MGEKATQNVIIGLCKGPKGAPRREVIVLGGMPVDQDFMEEANMEGTCESLRNVKD